MGSSDDFIIWADEDLEYTIQTEGNLVSLIPSKARSIGELIGFIAMGLIGLGMCLTALSVGINELILPDSDSICGHATEVEFGEETIYCLDDSNTFNEDITDVEIAEQHFRYRYAYDDFWVEHRWEYLDDEQKFVVFGFNYGDYYDCWIHARSASFGNDWNLEEVGHYWMYDRLPDWCYETSDASENLTYVDGSHPFNGEDLYYVPPEGGMEYISVHRYSTNSIRHVDFIDPNSDYFQEAGSFETIVPQLFMLSVGSLLIGKADGRRPKIVFDTSAQTLVKKHKFYSEPLRLENVMSESLNLAVRGHEQTSVSVGGHDEQAEFTTRTHTGLELSYSHVRNYVKRDYVKLAFFDKMDLDSEFAQQLKKALGLETSESGDVNEKKDDENPKIVNEASVVENEFVEPKLDAFWNS